MWSNNLQRVPDLDSRIDAGCFYVIHDQRQLHLNAISNAVGVKFGEWISYLTQEKSPPPYEGPLNGDYWANKLTAVPIFSSRVLIGKELAKLLSEIALSDVFLKHNGFAKDMGEETKIGIVAVSIARQLLKNPSLIISEPFDFDSCIDWEFCRRLAGYVYYRQRAKGTLSPDSLRVMMPWFRAVARDLGSSCVPVLFATGQANEVLADLNLLGFSERILQFSRDSADKGEKRRDRAASLFRFLTQPRDLTVQAERLYLSEFQSILTDFVRKNFSDTSTQAAILNCNVDCLARMSLILAFKGGASRALDQLNPRDLAAKVVSKVERDIKDALLLAVSDYEGIYPFIRKQTKGRELIVPGSVRRAFKNERARILAAALLCFSDPFLNATVQRQPQGIREKVDHWRKLLRRTYNTIFETRSQIPLE